MRAGPIFACALMLALLGFGRDIFDDWVNGARLPNLNPAISDEILDRNNILLRAYTVAGGRWRLDVGLDDVDAQFIAGLIAYEDGRFYNHNGVDPIALLRAAGQALRYGRVVSGASTLTMQVARLLEGGATGQMGGKWRQIRLALALERQLTKADILSLYLKLAPYGGNLEGVRAASLAYFGKEPRRLTLSQAALLIALPQSPETRRPDRAHTAATRARARVLARLADAGLITQEAAQTAQHEAVPRARQPFPNLASHLADRIRAQNPAQAQNVLSIDKPLQASFESLAQITAQALGAQVQIALMVADHRTGQVLALVGSGGYRADGRAGFMDMTQALRSPGSTLKPLIYGLAFDEGLAHPETLIEDRPTDFNGYRPQNFDRQFRGTVRVRTALQQSLNIPVVALTQSLGPERVLASLRRAGVGYDLPAGRAGLAIGLGGIGVTLEGLVQLYGSFANGGVALPLTYTANALPPSAPQRLLSPSAAWALGDILAGLPPPMGAPANRLAYKTGTSYGNRDAWAIGYDGAHVVGVWIGRPDGTPMPGALGADLAAPVLFAAFARLKPALEPQPPAPPETLLVANAQLPAPLRHFTPRGFAFETASSAPKLIFPPDGAEVELLPQGLMLQIEGGTAPYTVLVNNLPLITGLGQGKAMINSLTAGFVTLSVIDARGQSSRSHLRLAVPD